MAAQNHLIGLRRTLTWALLLALVASCRSVPQENGLIRFEFSQQPLMGTRFAITLYASDQLTARKAADAAFLRVAHLERIMTDYDPNSEIRRLCRRPVGEPTVVSRDLFRIIEESQRVAKETGGAFDITVGPFVHAWRAARKSKVLPTQEELARMRQAVGFEKLCLDPKGRTVTLLAPNMELDLGGIGKGYGADEALAVLREHGIKRAIVAASGDIAIGDAPPGKAGWRVDIGALGDESNGAIRRVLLHNAGVSTSGDSEQFFEINGVRYSHIIDPSTGLGMTNRIQDTIIGPHATITDGLDTPINIMGVRLGMALIDSQPKLAALVVTKDATGMHVFLSRQFGRRFGRN
jgi:thiamine biosynthesis lipoprotein